MNLTLSSLAFAAAASIAALGAPALAAPVQPTNITPVAYQENTGAQDRIALSGKLRLLSQQITAAACHVPTSADPDAAVGVLTNATTEFDMILDALEFGNADLNVQGAEERRKTLARIADVRSAWAPFKTAADAVASGDASAGNLQVLYDQNMPLLEASATLMAEVSGQYSNPADMVQADSFLINIAGRQPMLAQKISKESCMMMSGAASPDTADALTGSMSAFSSSLIALRDGMPSAGIRKPPTKEIADGLNLVLSEWKSVEPNLQDVLSGKAIDADAVAHEFDNLTKIMMQMNDIVDMYTEATKVDS